MKTDPINPANMFADTLVGLNRGRTPIELSDALAEVVSAVKATGRKGKLTLTITVAPLKDHENAVELRDEIKANLPKSPRKPRILYATPEGLLTSEEPDQEQFKWPAKAQVIDDAPDRKPAAANS